MADGSSDEREVGWVERTEPHRRIPRSSGGARCLTHPTGCRLPIFPSSRVPHMPKFSLLLSVLLLILLQTAAGSADTIVLDGRDKGRTFEGLGVASTSASRREC